MVESGVKFPHRPILFLQKLIGAKNAEHGISDDVLCEICDEKDNKETASETDYCVDCNRKMCKHCGDVCTTVPHQVTALGAEVDAELLQKRGSYCDHHEGELTKLYCLDDECNLCPTCLAENHSGHNCVAVDKVVGDFVKTIKTDIQSVLSRVDDFRKCGKQLESEMQSFTSSIKREDNALKQRGDAMIKVVQDHVTKLHQELQTVQENEEKSADSRRQELQLALTALESFTGYLHELLEKGSACDITRAAKTLRSRASELLQTYVSPSDYSAPRITYIPMNIDVFTTGQHNFAGRIMLKNGKSNVDGDNARDVQDTVSQRDTLPMLHRVIKHSNSVYEEAQSKISDLQSKLNTETEVREDLEKLCSQRESEISSLKNEVDKLRSLLNVDIPISEEEPLSDEPYKETQLNTTVTATAGAADVRYDYGKSGDIREVGKISAAAGEQLRVDGLTLLDGELFVLRDVIIYVYNTSADSSQTTAANSSSSSTSSSSQYYPLLRHFRLQQLKSNQYNDMTSCGRNRCQSDVSWLMHAIQLNDGRYVFCHGYEGDHRVIVVGNDGKVQLSCGRGYGRGVGQLAWPRHVTVDVNSEFIFVADCANRRVVLLR